MASRIRRIKESPIEIGVDEVVPYTLTIPDSWGTASSPTVVVKNSDDVTISGAISGTPTITSNVLSFTVDAASALVAGRDYRLEAKFSVTGGTLEAWGEWQVRK